MKYQETCPHCAGVIACYTHNINRLMIIAFQKLVEKYLHTKQPVNINTDLELDHNQKCNLPKMQYYGLIVKVPDGWAVTNRGLKFYYNELPVLMPVATLNNETIPDDHPAWKTHKKPRVEKYISQIDGYIYKKRPEYQQEKSKQGVLL
jgi:hypothetical protein